MQLFRKASLWGATVAGFVVAATAHGADYVSPLYGGGGGNAYIRDCGANAALVGLQGRYGMWIDQLTPVCQSIGSTGTLGQIFTQARVGGSGGTNTGEVRCQFGKVVTGARIRSGSYIEKVNLVCSTWDPATKAPSGLGEVIQFLGTDARTPLSGPACPAGQVGKGIKGKAAIFVDSMALVCNVWNQ